MSTSTASKSNNTPHVKVSLPVLQTIHAPPLPESPIDAFGRHEGVPGHQQGALKARIGIVGAGGLGGTAAMGLVRSGATILDLFDHDSVDRTNLPRQLFYKEDLFENKALRLARNLCPHAIAGATITGIALSFEEGIKRYPRKLDVLVVGVDNNACRLHCVEYARRHRIPAVFTMLSLDGMRCHCFLQGQSDEDPCLWCALPNLDPAESASCDASAIISSCFLASAFTVFFTHRALMGWPAKGRPFNFREADLLGSAPDRTAMVTKRPQCPVCRGF